MKVRFCTALLVGVVLAHGSASAQGRGRRAAAEHRVEVTGAGEAPLRRARVAANPENVEELLYLRSRSDALGANARRFHDALLERMLRQREGLVDQRRAQAISLLEEFVRVEPERAAEMPDALLRLAELRWEEARARYLTAYGRWQEIPQERRPQIPPTPDYRRCLELYDRILERHRDFPRYDLVLYMKAYALVEKGETDPALALYRRILAEFPRSSFVPDAHMAVAESYFTGNYDYPRALAEYDKVMRYRESELFDIALFKSAWCLWRLNRNTEAATRFRQVLDLGQRRHLSGARRRRLRELQNEALDYLIQVFTEDERNSAQDVFRFLREIGGERYAQRVLVRLSTTYYDQGRYESGIQAYRLLLELDPTSPKAPEYQRLIAQGYAALEDVPNTIAALEVLASRTQHGGEWARQQGDVEAVNDARRLGEQAIRTQALRYHEEAQRERQTRRFEQAAALYRLHVRYYADAPTAYEVEFYLAEILFHRLQRYDEAGAHYISAARKNRRGRFTRDALYNAIAAFEHVREAQIAACLGRANAPPPVRPPPPQQPPGAQQPPQQPQQPADPCGESDNDRKFSQAIELYVQLYPNDPDLPEILFRQGKLYYDHRIFDPAVRLFGQLLERYPTSPFASHAGELILDSFNRAQDYGNIERWARRLKTAPAFQSDTSQRRLDALIVQSVFKTGEQLAARGQHARAADAYFRAAEEFPREARARQAYYNAGVERQRAGDLGGAAQAYDRLIRRYPGSREGALGAWAAAQMYESIAQFRDAARYYEAYGDRFPQGEKAADALYNAVLLRVTAGDAGPAVADARKLIERFPRHQSVDDVYFLMARAHEERADWRNAAETYREYVRRTHDLDRQVEGQTRLGQVLLRSRDPRGASRAFDAAVALGRRHGSSLHGGLYYAAQARYLQGDQVLAEFESIRIAGDVAGLRRRLEQKSQLLQRAATIYSDVVEFRVAEWVTAALFKIGRSYEIFATALRDAPVPQEIRGADEQAYRDQLSSFIVPIEEHALEAYEGGYRKALELRIFNSWTARLREALTRLNDVQYPPLREVGGDIVEAVPLAMPAPLTGLSRDSAGGSRRGRSAPAPRGRRHR